MISTTEQNLIIDKLDLQDFIQSFKKFFARDKDVFFSFERDHFEKLLKELESLPSLKLPSLPNLDDCIWSLQKFGILRLENILHFIHLIEFFIKLKARVGERTPRFFEWLNNIVIPDKVLELITHFEHDEFSASLYPRINSLQYSIKRTQIEISKTLQNIKSHPALAQYLIDEQTHFVNQSETLLVKSGYAHVLKGHIISRTQSGFFYVLPNEILTLKQRIASLEEELQNEIYEACKNISNTFAKYVLFLKFINSEFDKVDHLNARISFARANNYEFMQKDEKRIILQDFIHPNLKYAKPLTISIERRISIITGVNAGGKTMLLKSILATSVCCKYLIPMRINAAKSRVKIFKHIFAIIQDPQNSKDDISTFSGRMFEFKHILNKDDFLLGIDEIELGTDSSEASSLYKVLIEELDKNSSIIITTHHKHLASMLSKRDDVELFAALFDEARALPLFSFMQGSIGNSYAFESALRCGLPPNLVAKAKSEHHKNVDNLNELIIRSSRLELELQEKIKCVDEERKILEGKIKVQDEKLAQSERILQEDRFILERTYQEAIKELKGALKLANTKQIYQTFNKAHKILNTESAKSGHLSGLEARYERGVSKTFNLGDFVKYGSIKGEIIDLDSKTAHILSENGVKIRLNTKLLESSVREKTTSKFYVDKSQLSSAMELDLRGKRAEEAIDELDIFISNALLAGFKEVHVIHGYGSGRLGMVVSEFLKQHRMVKTFYNARPNEGGSGVKIIEF